MDYNKARDLTWKILVKHNVNSLPIDIEKICRDEGINIFTYRQADSFIKSLDLDDGMLDSDAFSIGSVILYNEEKPHERIRFSIAHELGHILMHINRDVSEIPTLYNRDDADRNDPMEQEANIFASRILAPLCVLQFIDVNSAKEIAALCDISYTAAKHRFERLCTIRKRSSQRKREMNHSTFLTSNYERQLHENFYEFIEENKKR